MRCIICDHCKKIIESPSQVRVLTCSRPVKKTPENSSGPFPARDTIWEKELCVGCALAVEQSLGVKAPPAEDPGA